MKDLDVLSIVMKKIHAYNLIDDVAEMKNKTFGENHVYSKEISKLNQKKIGNEIKCLIDDLKAVITLEDQNDSPDVDNNILIKSDNIHLRIGEFYNVIIDDASDYDLFGSIK